MPKYKVRIDLSKTYEAYDHDDAFNKFIDDMENSYLKEDLKTSVTTEELPDDSIEVEDDEFYFDLNEFDDEAQLTVIGEEKIKILEVMKEVIGKTIDAVKYQEPNEEEVNFSRLAGYVSDMVELIGLENNNASDEEVLETIKRINIGVSKLKSNADIERYAQDFNEVNGLDVLDEIEDESKDKTEDDSDDEFDF